MRFRFFKLVVLLVGEGNVEICFQSLMYSVILLWFKPTYDSGD